MSAGQRRKSGWPEFAVAMALFAAFVHVISAHPGRAGEGAAAGAAAVAWARGQAGAPYLYGAPRWAAGAAPPGAYDCASLAQWAWAEAGVHIPPTSETQWAGLPHVPMSALRPGDLVFFTGSAVDAPPGHVVLFAGAGLAVEAYGRGVPVHVVPLPPGAWGAARP